MDYKEKIKVAKELLKEADAIEYDLPDSAHAIRTTVYSLFPELKEGEDEKIRKEIIQFIRMEVEDEIVGNKWLAWLEKQGEQMLDGTFINVYDVREDFVNEVHRVLSSDYDNDRANQIIGAFDSLPTLKLEKQGEQKPVDKVEPKFNFMVGQWIVATGKCVYLIAEIDGFNVTLVDNIGNEYVFDVSSLADAHLWTIQDAKDGDVLATEDSVFIFKYIHNEVCKSYCEVIGNSELGLGFEFSINCVYPAIKEQRDLLFQKMEEAGYEWDGEKKELKKIHVIDEGKSEMDYCFTKTMNGKKINPAWSEEDERMYKAISIALSLKNPEGYLKSWYITPEDADNWLKLLKERYTWKPSDEQMHYLYWIANVKLGDSAVEQEVSKHLNELYKDLKKLKG